MITSTYAFILGNHPALSIAEVLSVLPETEVLSATHEFLMLRARELFQADTLLHRLGGTQRLYEVEKILLPDITPEYLAETLRAKDALCHSRDPSAKTSAKEEGENLVHNVKKESQADSTEKPKGKLLFALDWYGTSGKERQKKLLVQTKKVLSEAGQSSRFLNREGHNVPNALIIAERLVERGEGLAVFTNKQDAWVGRLCAIQDISGYAQRDMNRPERDMDIGLMPPKLAQMVINLAGLQTGQSLYDPFCGTGGILMEGVLMNMTCYGSDINARAIEKAKRNISWILNNRGLELKDTRHRLFVKDARTLDSLSFPFDAIVTEGTLGPRLTHTADERTARNIEQDLAAIHIPFLTNLAKYLARKNVPVVVCLPVFRVENGILRCTNLLDSIRALHYTPISLFGTHQLPDAVASSLGLKADQTASLIYLHPGQKVGREIFRFQYNPTKEI